MCNAKPKESNDAIGRIIVVDDEAEVMGVFCKLLAGQGYETAGFLTGAEALAVLKEREFDLLLTDLMMPGMDGIELIRAGIEIDPYLIGIIVTGHGTVETAVEAMKSGAFDYILKPFRLNTLLPLLSRAMQVRNLRLENIQLKETVAIHELGKAISFSTDLHSILNRVADAALQQCGADEVSIMLPTKGGSELYVAVSRGGHPENLGEHAPIDQGIAGWVARNREPVVLKGGIDDPRMAPIRPRDDIHIAVSMPMLSQGKLVGVLNLNITKKPRQFTSGQLKALGVLVSIIAPILENTALYIQIRQGEKEYRSIFENAIEGIFRRSPDGRLIAANPAFARLFGYDSPEELIANVTDFVQQIYVDPCRGVEFARLMEAEGGGRNFEYQARRKDGSLAWISVNGHAVRDENGVLLYYEGMSEDVTERKISVSRLRLSKEILDTLNRPNNIMELINDILRLLKESTGSEAVGIRLRVGEDYPYYVNNGFSDDFLKDEDSLWARDADGGITRDSKGDPYLEGRCGNVLRGRTDHSLPFFTEGGSFWTNSITKHQAENSERKHQSCVRNRCNAEGYESLALIPLRSGEEIIGLLQFCDTRQDLFFPDMIRFLEGIGASIGIAVARGRSVETLRKSIDDTVRAMGMIVEQRDPYTAGHQERVANMAAAIAREMDLSEDQIFGIRMTGMIHDIGKMNIPAEILSKPTQLSPIELRLIHTHAEAGYRILETIAFPYPVATIAFQHHERIDGSGYPQGLKGDEILLEARIIAAADVVEAMASHRPYRPSLGIDAALDEIEKNSGLLYDSTVADACLRLFREKGFQMA